MNKIIRSVKNSILIFMSFVFIMTMIPATALTASAQTNALTDDIPSYLRIPAGIIRYDQIRIKLADYDCRLTNLKSSSKNLKLCITQSTHYKQGYGTTEHKTEYWIGCYALKEGTYKVTFNLKKNGKVQKKAIKIYAYNDAPFKSITFAGKKVDIDNNPSRMAPAKEGVFKVIMNKGYKLKKIQKLVVVMRKNSYSDENEFFVAQDQPAVYIKNGARTKLSNEAYSYTRNGKTISKSMLAETVFKIYYIDKHTKKEESKSVTLYMLKE